MVPSDRVAIATDYAGQSTSVESLYQSLERIAKAGFTDIHWCNEWDSEYLYSDSELAQIKDWLDHLDLRVTGIHASEGVHRPEIHNKFHTKNTYQNRKDYTSFNEYNRVAGVELVLNRFRMAQVLETTEVVLHMQLPYGDFKDSSFKKKYFETVTKSLREIEAHPDRGDVRLCLENMIGTPNHHQFFQFDLLLETFSANFLGLCYDIGHEFITTGPDEEAFPFVRRYKDRLYAVHFSDNKGLLHEDCWTDDPEMTKCDMHLLPFAGDIDYDTALKHFAETSFERPITLEVSKRNRESEEFLKAALDSGLQIASMVNSYREEN